MQRPIDWERVLNRDGRVGDRSHLAPGVRRTGNMSPAYQRPQNQKQSRKHRQLPADFPSLSTILTN